ncbi:MAG TPA: dihydrolipoyllysine-residue succinyltransferase [Luteolibacter sp.]|nr:dihydrolipoyllysine-residue succinyltransferase [Luteolibacter sp.]
MAIEVTIPASGESVTTANVARWHKKNGERVARGETLVTLETDKVSNELEAAADGVLEIVVNEGEEVPIGTLIARIEETERQPETAAKPDNNKEAKPAAKPEPAADAKPVDIKVPASGESVTSANVASWRKNDGETVVAGETLVVLETDKVSNELESPVDGVLKVLVPEGEEVAIGTVIANITPGGDGARTSVRQSTPEAPQKPATAAVPKAAKPAGQPTRDESDDGRVDEDRRPPLQDDGRTTRRKMSMLRRKIATHLVNAQQTAAILTTFNEVDMSAVMDLRKAVQEEFVKKHGVKLGFMSFFVKAVTQALKDCPSINARIEGNDIIENHFYDIGVAIGTEKGLVVPVLRDCDGKSFAQIEKDILDYATKAREGKMLIEDLQGGVFSISNGGTYGSLLSTPILNPPQSGILGMHAIQQRPVAVDGKVVIRPMMYLALSYDHRLVDGKEAVTFLIRIKELLEAPARLMLEM